LGADPAGAPYAIAAQVRGRRVAAAAFRERLTHPVRPSAQQAICGERVA